MGEGGGYGTHRRNARIAAKFLPAGTYTIEATTFGYYENYGDLVTGGCIPNSAILPAACASTVLHGGDYWGRHEHSGQYRLYSGDADVDCDSLTLSDKAVF